MKRLRILVPGFVLVALLAPAAGGALAQTAGMRDPMQPPADYVAGGQSGSAGPVLQSVVIGPTWRYAIIDGERVAPGERYGGARVVHIDQGTVTLRDGAGDTVLKLYPDIKQLIDVPVPQRAATRERKKQ